MSLGFNSPNMAATFGIPTSGYPMSDIRHPCLLPPAPPVTSTAADGPIMPNGGRSGGIQIPHGAWLGHPLFCSPTAPRPSVGPAVSHGNTGGGAGHLDGSSLSPSAMAEIMSHPGHSSVLASSVQSILTMADPNLDSRSAEILENWRQFQQAAIAHNLDPNILAMYHSASFDPTGSHRRKNATRETTSTLKAWLNEHRKNPYPTKGEKIMLAIITKMTLTQVSTWFANARRRLKKENKMTWTPRNRVDEDDDKDLDDGDDSEDVDCEGNDDNPLQLMPRDLECSSSREGEEEREHKSPNAPSSPMKPKIWSIVETLERKDPVKPSAASTPKDAMASFLPAQSAGFFPHPSNGLLLPPHHHQLMQHHASGPLLSTQSHPHSNFFFSPHPTSQTGSPFLGALGALRPGVPVGGAYRFPVMSLPNYQTQLETQEQLFKMQNSRRLAESSNIPPSNPGASV